MSYVNILSNLDRYQQHNKTMNKILLNRALSLAQIWSIQFGPIGEQAKKKTKQTNTSDMRSILIT